RIHELLSCTQCVLIPEEKLQLWKGLRRSFVKMNNEDLNSDEDPPVPFLPAAAVRLKGPGKTALMRTLPCHFCQRLQCD
ncbi:mCG1046403, isoform CRA_b, partial [Mus musculus]